MVRLDDLIGLSNLNDSMSFQPRDPKQVSRTGATVDLLSVVDLVMGLSPDTTI